MENHTSQEVQLRDGLHTFSVIINRIIARHRRKFRLDEYISCKSAVA